MTSWRDILPIHKAAELFPMMSADELRDLGDDIQKNGLQSPVVLLQPKDDGVPRLLDGRNRLDAMAKVGMTVVRDGKLAVAHETINETKFDPVAYVISANFRRRHLTGEQRDDVIRKLKAERPELSIRTVAEITDTPKSTVARAVNTPPDPEPTPTAEGVPVGTPAQTEAVERPDVGLPKTSAPEEAAPASGISEQETSSSPTEPEKPSSLTAAPQPRVTGRDGKSYPAKAKPADRRLSAATKAAARKAPLRIPAGHRLPPGQERDQAVGAVARLLRSERLVDALDDLARLLRDARAGIVDIPIDKRVEIGRGYLQALGVTLDDLRPIEGGTP